MKLQLAALLAAVAATFAGPGTHRADAQITSYGTSIVGSAPGMPMSPFGGSVAVQDAPTFPYSYYAAFPNPARQYVPYGPSDPFPFHGTPYGRPYDRWTWAYMTGPPSNLQRYYYPPVR